MPAADDDAPDGRLRVRKTYKLAIGGAFPRSESGRSYPVHDASGALLAHAAQASRKDVRDAVVAARKAFPAWSGATAYNRGQVIYRVAEMLDGRREQFAAEVAAAEGVTAEVATRTVDDAIDRLFVDGFVNGFARWTYSAGLALRNVQTGKLRSYVTFIVVGAVALWVVLSFFWSYSIAG